MVFNDGEAQRLIEILSEKAGIIQDTWHKVGPPSSLSLSEASGLQGYLVLGPQPPLSDAYEGWSHLACYAAVFMKQPFLPLWGKLCSPFPYAGCTNHPASALASATALPEPHTQNWKAVKSQDRALCYRRSGG